MASVHWKRTKLRTKWLLDCETLLPFTIPRNKGFRWLMPSPLLWTYSRGSRAVESAFTRNLTKTHGRPRQQRERQCVNMFKPSTQSCLKNNFAWNSGKWKALSRLWLKQVCYLIHKMAEFILETSYPSRRIIRQTDNSSSYKSEDEFWRIICPLTGHGNFFKKPSAFRPRYKIWDIWDIRLRRISLRPILLHNSSSVPNLY